MRGSAKILPFTRNRGTSANVYPRADRRAVIRFPGGHELRINHAHVAAILDAKAALLEDRHD